MMILAAEVPFIVSAKSPVLSTWDMGIAWLAKASSAMAASSPTRSTGIGIVSQDDQEIIVFTDPGHAHGRLVFVLLGFRVGGLTRLRCERMAGLR
jgi:hypothetical protein